MLRRATPADSPQLVHVLSRAFEADPLYRFLVRPGPGRDARLAGLFELILRHLSDDWREVFTTANTDGVALWLRPGMQKVPALRQALLLPAFARVLGVRAMPPGLRIMAHMDALHARYAPEPHFYLSILGVDPARQGQGLGRELLSPMLERCDRERRRIYLETAQPKNVPYYERHGFRVLAETQHVEFPTLFSMARDPA
ncbi:MAG TPA: GNAT family N-acetyltransferase [Polyangiaceae bacterium]|nr:GNAT family N-acetyltransferase [Polyangiaceae bacterium]